MIIVLTNDTPAEHVIDAVIAVSDEMITACSDNDYDRLTQLDNERLAYLAWLFDADSAAGSRFESFAIDGQRAVLEQFLASNNALIAATSKIRDQFANKCNELNKAKQASQAYDSQSIANF